MSSIEPNNSGGEVDGGEEISGGFVVARGDGPELFEFAEEVLDQVTRLIEFRVEIGGCAAVARGGMTADLAATASAWRTR